MDVQGPRLGVKLMLLGVPLALFVPWVSYLLLGEMERLSVQMQSNQQQLIAESIAVSFNGRDALFSDLPVTASEGNAALAPTSPTLVATPIETLTRPRLDGSITDWGEQARRSTWFGDPLVDGSFTLSLGTHGGTLYAYLEARDSARVYRNPEVLRLNNADQVRIGFIEPNGEDGRIAVTLSSSGGTTAYRMDRDWRFAQTGRPESSVQGYVRELETGYAVELGLPFELLGSRRFFEVSVVDVDDAETREVRDVVGTSESNLVAYRSPDLLHILEGLGYSNMRVLVLDAEHRIRAETGSYRSDASPVSEPTWQARALRWLTAGRDAVARWFGGATEVPTGAAGRIADEVASSALAGEPIARRRHVGDVDTILAGHPIVSTQGAVIGMISVEQNIDDILFFQREAIDRIALVSVASFFIVPLCLVAFAGRLTWRIGRLRRAAAAAIDDYGRLRVNALSSGTDAKDEIGDLARSVSNMLARLDEHNSFLKKMPRTLRHEINNPLNTLNTSLEHLAQENAELRDSKYLESARRGVLRIGAIVQNLADAANLEDSLISEDKEIIDIQALIESYVSNCQHLHPGHNFVFRGVPGPVYANVSDYRIEQLLDKLIDNAVDFHRANSPIKVQLDVQRGNLRIVVANRGPLLPADVAGSLFESMVSRRAPRHDLHFGLGLYVVRLVAQQHGGSAHAVNLVDGSGVAIIVRLPLAEKSQPTPAPAPSPSIAAAS